MLGVAGRLIDLAEERLTASQVLDLADREPVRRRFHFDDEELARLEDWVAESGIRWGLDAGHREPFKLAELPERHVAHGAGPRAAGRDDDRGRAAAARRRAPARRRRQRRDRPRGPLRRAARPPARSPSTRCATRSRSRRGRTRSATRRTRSPSPAPRETWQRAELRRLLADVVAEAGGSETPLALGEVRVAAGRPPPGPPDADQLPHRQPDRLHARADALGPAPGRVPARARRRRVPAQGAARRRRPGAARRRTWATATRAPRTGRCCSTR